MLRPVWLFLALIAAAGTAAREVYVKRARRAVDEFAVVFWAAAGAGALLLPLALAEGAGLRDGFWRALLVSGVINVIAALLIARAVHHSDLSLVAPLKSLTPLFMLVTAPLLIGEHATPTGVAGVAVIVAGAYLLSEPDGAGLLAPYRALVRDSGAREMLVVALIFSVSAVVDKIGVLASGPLAWAASLNLFVAAGVGPLVVVRGRRAASRDAPESGDDGVLGGSAAVRRDLAGAAFVTAIALAAQMAAIALTAAAYVIAVKRTSVLFAVLAGGVLFGERGTPRRAIAALIMVAGFALVTVAG
jgi:drug/metabolite transporter (DMT)-like permease